MVDTDLKLASVWFVSIDVIVARGLFLINLVSSALCSR